MDAGGGMGANVKQAQNPKKRFERFMRVSSFWRAIAGLVIF